MQNKKQKFVIRLAIPLVVFVICMATMVGSSNINMFDIISIISHKLFGTGLAEGIEPKDVSIIWVIRLPRVLLAFMVGAALAVSGSVIQSILKNPLASPYTLGVSSGASLGVGLYIIMGLTIPFLGTFALPVIGFICGLITVFSVIFFARKVDKHLSNNTIILAGMVFSLFTNSILTTMTALSSKDITAITLWQMGSFGMRGWSYVRVAFPFLIVGLCTVLRYCCEMDILSFGEDQARTVGVDTKKVKTRLMAAIAILTGSAVALSGVIGFIDLITPHVVRKLVGSNHLVVIPMSIAFGGCFMVIADLVARTIVSPSELPVGAITALIGAPFFAFIYFSKRSR